VFPSHDRAGLIEPYFRRVLVKIVHHKIVPPKVEAQFYEIGQEHPIGYMAEGKYVKSDKPIPHYKRELRWRKTDLALELEGANSEAIGIENDAAKKALVIVLLPPVVVVAIIVMLSSSVIGSTLISVIIMSCIVYLFLSGKIVPRNVIQSIEKDGGLPVGSEWK